MWWLIIIGVIVVFFAVLVIRAAAFKPYPQQKFEMSETSVDEEKAVENLAAMIRCKTVSFRQEGMTDEREFEKFRNLLKEKFPNVHKNCSLERIGDSAILYHLKGKSSDKPTVLMAHYDVVPANESAWEKPAFEGVIEDNILWGRGTLDTKVTLCGVMEAAEHLLAKDFVPENDLYFAFSGDEEIAGDSAPAVVETLQQRGVVPALVVDEGGAVVEDIFPGVKQPCALIGIAEKGMLDVELLVETKGGHASAPPPHTSVGVLAKAVTLIEDHPFKSKLTKPVAEMFDTLGRHSTFVYKLIFANLWCFMPVLNAICKKKGGELNALMRTTCAFTMMEGSNATNVLPPVARMVANLRLLDDTTESAIEYLKGVANNSDIKFRKIHGMNPCKYSETKGESWDKLKKAVAQTWPEALISPYIMVACSDSRHYCRISDHVYRFSAMALSGDERKMIHGNNEQIPLDKIVKTVQFYIRLMSQC